MLELNIDNGTVVLFGRGRTLPVASTFGVISGAVSTTSGAAAMSRTNDDLVPPPPCGSA